MISFWVPAAGSFGIELWLARRAPELTDHFAIRHYESLTADQDIVGGAHIFTALDWLGPAGREAVAALHQAVRERFPRDPVLNHPERAVRRFELLTRAHQAVEGDHRRDAWETVLAHVPDGGAADAVVVAVAAAHRGWLAYRDGVARAMGLAGGGVGA